jgi:hypothetical protein
MMMVRVTSVFATFQELALVIGIGGHLSLSTRLGPLVTSWKAPSKDFCSMPTPLNQILGQVLNEALMFGRISGVMLAGRWAANLKLADALLDTPPQESGNLFS